MNDLPLIVRLHWYNVQPDNDPLWNHNLALYAYLAPQKPDIYYIGKCDRTTVRGRWRDSAKRAVWNCISQRCKSHRLIVAEIETHHRITRQLLADVESLLINRINPPCNVQNVLSRGFSRPGMKVECFGAWPISPKTFRDKA